MANKKDKARVNTELDGFEVNINKFGEIQSSLDIDKINKFLNQNVEDKKLKDREDFDELKSE